MAAFKKRVPLPLPTALFEQYIDALPSPQTAVDAVPGWTCMFPPEVPATAGALPLFADERIRWMLERYGAIDGCHIVELGPLEAAHTMQMERAGAGRIDAIEANRLAFLRCLVFKELVGLTKSKFHLGNFVTWLEQPDLHYDLLVASGVLYHLNDPLHVLELMARCSDAIFLWTHYVSEAAMPPGDPRRSVFRDSIETRRFHGVDVRLYPRSYHSADKSLTFCGGLYDDHRWIERDDLLAVLSALGFDTVEVGRDEVDHPNGPCFCVFARRTKG